MEVQLGDLTTNLTVVLGSSSGYIEVEPWFLKGFVHGDPARSGCPDFCPEFGQFFLSVLIYPQQLDCKGFDFNTVARLQDDGV